MTRVNPFVTPLRPLRGSRRVILAPEDVEARLAEAARERDEAVERARAADARAEALSARTEEIARALLDHKLVIAKLRAEQRAALAARVAHAFESTPEPARPRKKRVRVPVRAETPVETLWRRLAEIAEGRRGR